MGKGVVYTKVFERELCCYNCLLLEGDEASEHVKRCEANLSYDTSYLYMFKLCVVDSLDSDLYSHPIGCYINHSWSPNVAVKTRMIAGTPTVLLYGRRVTSAPVHTFLSNTSTGEPPYLIGCVPHGGGALLSQPMRLLVPALPQLSREDYPWYP